MIVMVDCMINNKEIYTSGSSADQLNERPTQGYIKEAKI